MMTSGSRPHHLVPTAAAALTSADVRLVGDPEPAVAVTGVCLDSRRVQPGDLYAALPGAHVHGARLVSGALAAGARARTTTIRSSGYRSSSDMAV